MRLNEHTVIWGDLIVLVPYDKEHVPQYHEWMKSEKLQRLTGSEPLSLEEEYEMQENWRKDPDKCTFIILEKEKYDATDDEVESMIGDTNFFLRREDGRIVAEIEIMIAELSARNRGFGTEAVLLMLRYGLENLHISLFEAKIKSQNVASINLFTKIGFEQVDENPVFDEVVVQREADKPWREWLFLQTQNYIKEERMITQNRKLSTSS